jgi:hypothetical protein
MAKMRAVRLHWRVLSEDKGREQEDGGDSGEMGIRWNEDQIKRKDKLRPSRQREMRLGLFRRSHTICL